MRNAKIVYNSAVTNNKQQRMKEKLQNTIKGLVASLILLSSLEALIFYPEYLTQIVIVSSVVLTGFLFWALRVNIRSFSTIAALLTTILLAASSFLMMVFVEGTGYKQLYIGFSVFAFFMLVTRLAGMKVYEIQRMAYEQQYSYVDFSLLLSSFFFYAGFFGLYLHIEAFELWHLLLSIFLSNTVLFFLFFYFNDLWLRKIWLYVFVLTFIILEMTWTLSFWPTGLLGRGAVLFFAYYLLSGLGKHYLKETFSYKVLREYVIVGIIVLALILSTTQWTY